MNASELKNYLSSHPESVIDILEAIGCHAIKEYSTQFRSALPEGRNPTALRVNKENLSAKVYSNSLKTNGDIFNLIRDIKNISFVESLKLCHKVLGMHFSCTYTKPKSHPLDFMRKITKRREHRRQYDGDQLKIYDEDYLLKGMFNVVSLHLLKEGIIPTIQQEFNIHMSYDLNRIIIPHYHWEYHDELVGFNGRTLDEDYDESMTPKYFLMPVGYNKRHNLYGLSNNIDFIKEKGVVILLESEKAVLQLASMGYRLGVAVCSHDLTPEQAQILKSLQVEVIIAFDKDVDDENYLTTAKLLKSFVPVSRLRDIHDLLGAKDSPTDKGKKVFDYLLKRKEKIN